MPSAIPRSLLILLFLPALSFPVFSQDMEVGPSIGGSYYIGDLNPGKHFIQSQIAYGLTVRYNIDTRWSLRFGATLGKVKGNSSSSTFLPDNGLAFSSNLTDLTVVTEFNFFQYFTGSYRSTATPYIYTGLSFFFFNPVRDGVSLRSLGTEGQNVGYLGRRPYSKTGISIPFGIGGKFSLTNRLGLQVFWEIHKAFTDYIDDVSTTYYLMGEDIKDSDLEGLMSDPVKNHTPGMQRGNSGTDDWYAFFGAALTYKFSLVSKKKCRDMGN